MIWKELDVLYPFDGRWTVQLYNRQSLDSSDENPPSTCIHIVANQCLYNSMNIKINMTGDETSSVPFITWTQPEDIDGQVYRLELCDLFDVNSMRFGPEIGQQIRWETNYPNNVEMVWVRTFINYSYYYHVRSQNLRRL